MPTRQQRRAKARAPIKRKRSGNKAFLAVLVAVMLGGFGAAAFFRTKPPPITRGAIQGEHWHADYRIEICGRVLAPYPTVEGEIHTHGDGRIHVHPQSAANTLDNANLGTFFDSVETQLGQENGKTFMLFPNGERRQDGDACRTGGPGERWLLLVNGKRFGGDPAKYIIHDKDKVVLRFGPKATASRSNPLASPTPRAAATPAPTPARTPAPTQKR